MSLEDKLKNAEETMWPMTMEMPIDKAILTIKNAIRFAYDEVYEEAFAVAIDTMRKYQKIEQIMNQEQAEWGVVKDTWLYKEISEVIKNG